ncbi:MAG: hypothetical protein LBG44_10905 [Gemmatimonadota bacterium]|jgi:hypothetical protein|nr:hypothetical protein [Gemmatimonadota bacterium]
MKRALLLVLPILALAGAPDVSAQVSITEERGALFLKGGLIAPMTTFQDDDYGETSYANGAGYGVGAMVWPALGGKGGLIVNILRGKTDGKADDPNAPIVINSPTIYLVTAEAAFRLPMSMGYPYLSLGYGMKQYTWVNVPKQNMRDGALTGSVGYELRMPSLGAWGVNFELRGYRTNYRAFGVHGEVKDINGPMGGTIDGVPYTDLMFTTGVSLNF